MAHCDTESQGKRNERFSLLMDSVDVITLKFNFDLKNEINNFRSGCDGIWSGKSYLYIFNAIFASIAFFPVFRFLPDLETSPNL